jgi:hypothetical protein
VQEIGADSARRQECVPFAPPVVHAILPIGEKTDGAGHNPNCGPLLAVRQQLFSVPEQI